MKLHVPSPQEVRSIMVDALRSGGVMVEQNVGLDHMIGKFATNAHHGLRRVHHEAAPLFSTAMLRTTQDAAPAGLCVVDVVGERGKG